MVCLRANGNLIPIYKPNYPNSACDMDFTFSIVSVRACILMCLAQWFHSWLPLSAAFPFSADMTMSLVPQFGSSFATFRPALSHSGSTRPLSVILPVPASPPYNRPSGSSSSSPTSKVPMWKVCSPFAAISSVAPFLLFLSIKFHLIHTFFFF